MVGRWWFLSLFALQALCVSADVAVLTADSATATRGLTNPQNAFGVFDDTVALTSAWQSTGDTAVLTMSNFTQNGTVLNLTFAMRMNASVGWMNDVLAIQYSNDSGTNWFNAQTGTQPPANLTIYGNYTTSISSLAATNAFMVRLSFTKNQGPDGIQSGIDGVEAYVTYAPPPSVTLGAPANDSWQSTTQFTFTPSSMINFSNCSLSINGTLNATNQTPIVNGSTNTITAALSDGTYAWNVTCTDTSGFSGAGQERIVHIDATAPIVELQEPENESLYRTTQITFAYNVSEQVSNCSLLLNGTLNTTDAAVTHGIRQEFAQELESGTYEWHISCVNLAGLIGQSEIRLLEVQVHPPEISVIASPGVIVLNAGTTKQVQCNFTVYDVDGANDIVGANATFYLPPSAGVDNNLTHYSNTSCTVQSQTLTTKDFSCTADLLYYARNGSWFCNATAESIDGVGSAEINFTVDPLYALDIEVPALDFGEIIAGAPSTELVEPVRNVGNLPLAVAVRAGAPGEGVAVACPTVNVSADHMRYALTNAVSYDAKHTLSGTLTNTNLSIMPQQDAAVMRNFTYWQLMVPENVSDTGECVGSILFQAEPG